MGKTIYLSDYCVAYVSENNSCESCGDTNLPCITFDASYDFDDENKIDNPNPIFCYACFRNSGIYKKHLKLINEEKLKELISEFCKENIEIDYKTNYYNKILDKCKSIKDKTNIIELFEEIGWESANFK